VEVEAQSTARPRRKHSSEFKAQVIQACKQPGASMNSVARDHDLNSSLVRHWVKGRVSRGSTGQESAPSAQRAATPAAPSFVAVRLEDRHRAAAAAIRLEIRRDCATVIVDWPAQEAAACGAWLREWLR
jgi:transposase